MPLTIEGIDHVVLRVTDMTRSLDFYTRILGLPLERIVESLGLHQLRAGANLIDLVPTTALGPEESRGLDHLCLTARGDLTSVQAMLAAENVPILRGPVEVYGARGFGTSLYIADPNGYTIELKFPAARPVRFP